MPKTLLTDRMGCLKGATVAGLGLSRPPLRALRDPLRDACRTSVRGADPESKGLVENLVCYVKSEDHPQELSVAELVSANAKARQWCAEVNTQVHSEIVANPAKRLEIERPLMGELPALRARIGQVALRKVDRLSRARFGSARYSCRRPISAHRRAPRGRRVVMAVLLARSSPSIHRCPW